ncbi:MAG: ABC transporter ATP-binding protein [Candidatus Izemoplasmatales bacterium]|jgi:fluoroquinolone transport system ATP-binding protein|nr:ABC transporter ATP-binding protein [Candidatus Izemoplasmatales bacterium]MDD4595475.1 ABC transporter ATP-binding protein [Candidatus Izemoplasmatales bacterium]
MIKVKDLAFSYTPKPFIENVTFEVNNGEIFGFLGPSGAGKSTLQKILTGVLRHYTGSVSVNGVNVKSANAAFYEMIGVDFEYPSLYEKLSGNENLIYFASLYKNHRDIDALIKSVGLQFDANKRVYEYSKGMKSRLNFIKALLHNPEILFLDEPTNGLDPSNALMMKDIIRLEKSKGKTIILTTHNMQDATELCDRVAFIVDGKIRTIGTPRNLIMSRGAAQITYSYIDESLEKFASVSIDSTAIDPSLLAAISCNKLSSIHSSEPSLNDIFIEITGRSLQ